jgi:hypothetical protein
MGTTITLIDGLSRETVGSVETYLDTFFHGRCVFILVGTNVSIYLRNPQDKAVIARSLRSMISKAEKRRPSHGR